MSHWSPLQNSIFSSVLPHLAVLASLKCPHPAVDPWFLWVFSLFFSLMVCVKVRRLEQGARRRSQSSAAVRENRKEVPFCSEQEEHRLPRQHRSLRRQRWAETHRAFRYEIAVMTQFFLSKIFPSLLFRHFFLFSNFPYTGNASYSCFLFPWYLICQTCSFVWYRCD